MSSIEAWKDIPNYEGCFQASSLGRIKSVQRNRKSFGVLKERILNTSINEKGYEKISLRLNGVNFFTSVHRCVALAFIPNPFNKPRVNHKDNNTLNNVLSNLEWATHKEDSDHKTKQDRQAKGHTHGWYGKKGKDCIHSKLVLDMGTGIYYDSAKEAAYSKGIEYKTLCRKIKEKKTSMQYV